MKRSRLITALTGLISVACLAALVLASPASAAKKPSAITGTTMYPAMPVPTFKTVSQNVAVKMSDGVSLGATVTRPSIDGKTPAPGKFPVVLSITPYGRTLLCSCGDQNGFASRGLVGVVVDTRGTGGSEGNLNDNYFSPREARDGYELVEHFAAEPYSTGKVAMAGGSYVGITQYLTAEQQPPHLVAIVPQVALADLYRDAFTHGGIPNIFFDAQYLGVQGGPGLATPGGFDQVPMTIKAKIGQLLSTPIALAYLAHPNDDAFYRDRSPIYHANKIKVPVLILDGWRDGFVRGAFEMYQALAKRPGVETRLYVDPCTHKGCGFPYAPTLNPAGLDNTAAMQFEFLSHYLRGTPQKARPQVRTYVQGTAGSYLQSSTWPAAGTSRVSFALQKGAITAKVSRTVGTERYLTNPLAGITSPLDFYGTVAISPYVPTDQRLDSLNGITWKTPVLTEAQTIAGPTQLHLVASSTGKDTDWIAKLSDVAPDGSESLITEGYLRASHRALNTKRSTLGSPYHLHTSAVPIVPRKFYNFDIGLWPTAYKVAAGHRLSLRLTTYDVPTHAPASIDLNLAKLGTSSIGLILPSTNTVREGGSNPSTLLLPVFKG